ncbi:MAG TPA: type II toxin-antitoxin system VapC family toxin [Caulobacteraceae bacterium]|nr:type II toxin-antitoxin system VapC family toxin [Caulobacteraceae bacterium]
MTEWVLDASAVLALMRGEPGADQVAAALATAVVSSVNTAEVISRLLREGMEPSVAREAVLALGCPIISVDAELGFRAGALSPATQTKGLSLGERVCLALAEREQVPALTADRAWRTLNLDIQIELIR